MRELEALRRFLIRDVEFFVYAGTKPNTELYTELQLHNGFIAVNENQETEIDGVYAAGDICEKQVRQVATAVSDGTIAAIRASM